jgi:hypothetical protein
MTPIKRKIDEVSGRDNPIGAAGISSVIDGAGGWGCVTITSGAGVVVGAAGVVGVGVISVELWAVVVVTVGTGIVTCGGVEAGCRPPKPGITPVLKMVRTDQATINTKTSAPCHAGCFRMFANLSRKDGGRALTVLS